MCGIAGIFTANSTITDNLARVLADILASQHQRGPDYTGIKQQNGCILGSNRLSIVDRTESSNQPLSLADGAMTIVLNGEIFNFQELRSRLRRKGHVFKSQGDTEVLLCLYREYGEECIRLLRGQFAFAIFDSSKGTLFLARDPFGIKPLFYSYVSGGFVFASSFKALVKVIGFELNQTAFYEYMHLRYVLPPDTLANNINQLEPGHTLTVGSRGVHKKKYWDYKLEPKETTFSAAAATTYDMVIRSIAEQSAVDGQPIGVFLSGGLDSSIIASKAAGNSSVRSFSISFSQLSTDDNKFAKLMADAANIPHHVFNVASGAINDLVTEMVGSMDQPTGARDSFGMFLISKYVKHIDDNIKVVLTGTGADELFNGYANAYFRHYDTSINAGNLTNVLDSYISKYGFLDPQANRFIADAFTRSAGLKSSLLKKLESKFLPIVEAVGEVAPADFHDLFYCKTHLVGWELPVLDDTTSSCSLEGRVPFLSTELADHVFSMPGEYKYRAKIEKSVLRSAFSGALPSEIISRPKVPFSHQVMKSIERAVLPEYRVEADEIARSIFANGHVDHLIERHSDYFWRAIMLDKWLRANCIGSFSDICLNSGVLLNTATRPPYRQKPKILDTAINQHAGPTQAMSMTVGLQLSTSAKI